MDKYLDLEAIDKDLLLKLVGLHIVIIALANYTVQFPVTTFGLTWTWAMWVFPFTVVATDLTVRLSNKHLARGVIGIAFVPAIFISALLADWRIGLASGFAYAVGQLLDVTVFQKIRERTDVWWAAPMISTVCANIIDTYLFFGAAFSGSEDEFMAENWVGIANVDLVMKIVVCIVVFLPIYGMLLKWLTEKGFDVSVQKG